MAYNYSKLRGKIKEVVNTQSKFAEKIGCSETTLSAKLNNGADFTQKEISRAVEILRIPRSEISSYFFTPLV